MQEPKRDHHNENFFPTHFSTELSTAICSRSFVGTALPWRTLKEQEICLVLQPALSGATRADAGQAWAEGTEGPARRCLLLGLWLRGLRERCRRQLPSLAMVLAPPNAGLQVQTR